MVLKPEPIFKAVESIRQAGNAEVVVLSAAGRPFNQAEALRLAKAEQVIVICGRYEGIDERVVEHLATAEIVDRRLHHLRWRNCSGGDYRCRVAICSREWSERKNRFFGILFPTRKL